MSGDKNKARVAILMGSKSDLPVMEPAFEALKKLEIGYTVRVISAHRAPRELAAFAEKARSEGIQVFIAGAGLAAHLPGVIAAYTELPVIGVPVACEPLRGQDSLLSIVQMPKGVPVATVGIGNSYNAGLLAAQIIAAGGEKQDEALLKRFRDYKEELRTKVLQTKLDEA